VGDAQRALGAWKFALRIAVVLTRTRSEETQPVGVNARAATKNLATLRRIALKTHNLVRPEGDNPKRPKSLPKRELRATLDPSCLEKLLSLVSGPCLRPRQGNFAFLRHSCFFQSPMRTIDQFMLLSADVWQARAAAHRERARTHTLPARSRSDRGLPHPVTDFLFEYYPFKFAFLEHWHPASGVALEWNAPDRRPPYRGCFHVLENRRLRADPRLLTGSQRQRLAWIADLLEATTERAPNFACHGLHEWAMVYQGRNVRHERTLRLRLPQVEIDALVQSRALCCTHHDAFRFFALEARPLNRHQPNLENRMLLEQPGCVHANMDLYKWAAKAMPWAGSDLLLDCFELAMELRELDMRASPYDLCEWGLKPVRVELPHGRREYEILQKVLATKARPLRGRLILVIRETLALAQA
jgi:hypothetical protein